MLSGGGSKAMAQIGALRVIEEAGIELDYIGGTSMGAIVGALYSLGYSVDEIEAHLRAVDWDALLTNEIPRNRLSYFDRKTDDYYLLSLPVEDGKVKLPKGLNYAQYILKQLSILTQKAYQYEDFSQFPVPFFCVATNLENGQMRVFEDGRLMDALRATSAFPSLFTPYEIDGQLYIDGGVVNNYPVTVLKDKGVDVIIGVDVADFLYAKDDLNSVVRVLEQTSTFVNAYEQENQLKYTDILIKPHLPEATITTFNLFDTILARGEQAARQKFDALKDLAMADGHDTCYTRKCAGSPVKSCLIETVKIYGNKNTTKEYILGKLRMREGDEVSMSHLDKGIDQLYGTKQYDHIDFTLIPTDKDSTHYTLSLNVKEAQINKRFRLGLNYNDDFKTSLLLNYTHRNFLFKNSRLSADFAVGDNPRVRFNYFVDRGFIPTLGLKVNANRFDYRTYDNRRVLNQRTYFDISTDLFLQSTIRDAYGFGGGLQLYQVNIQQNFDIANFDPLNRGYINYYGFLDFDSFDDADYPTYGFNLKAQYRVIAERKGFAEFYPPTSVASLEYKQVIPFSKRFRLLTTLTGVGTIGFSPSAPFQIYLGSAGNDYINYIYPFIGYRYMELIGRNAITFRTDFYAQIMPDHFIILKGNVGKLDPTFNGLFASDVLLDGYALCYSYNSPLGPLEFNVTGSTNHSEIYTYIRLGFWF